MNNKNKFSLDDVTLLSNAFLFRGLSAESLESVLNSVNPEIKEFATGEDIYTPDDFESKVGLVLKGECTVERIKPDETAIPLNLLKDNDSFGVLAVFSAVEKFPTRVRAKKKSKIAFLDKNSIEFLIKGYPEIAMNIITFMGERIDFLNKKIATFSSDSTEESFARYLFSEMTRTNEKTMLLNLSKTAKTLNFGRASIYRAISALESKGFLLIQRLPTH